MIEPFFGNNISDWKGRLYFDNMLRIAFTTIPSLADLNGISGWNLRAFTDLLRDFFGALLCWLEPLVCFLVHVLIVVDGGEGVYCFFMSMCSPNLWFHRPRIIHPSFETELSSSSKEGFFGPKPLTIPQVRSGKLVPPKFSLEVWVILHWAIIMGESSFWETTCKRHSLPKPFHPKMTMN